MKKVELVEIQLEEITSATNNFNDSNCIGGGGFGKVYKGALPQFKERSMVAIKRLNSMHGQGGAEYSKEIAFLSRYTHDNLISLLGFCKQGTEMILVYEHASHGSLDRNLHSADLTWKQRVKICLGAAKGLNYLHDPRETGQRLIHCDIKSANILLDDEWNAKVADFGLSKIAPANPENSILVTNTLGTHGYCDPLFMETYTLTKESDVYSFGVVLFEVLCGRLCFEKINNQFKVLVQMWKESYEKKKLDEIIFEDLRQNVDQTSLEIFSGIAFECLKRTREERPTISFVVERLEAALRCIRFKPPKEYEDIVNAAVSPLTYESVEQLKVLLSEGFLVNDGKARFSINDEQEHMLLISIEQCLMISKFSWGRQYSHEYNSSFKVGTYETRGYKFKTRVTPQYLSPCITYAVNLIFKYPQILQKKTWKQQYMYLTFTLLNLGEEKRRLTVYIGDKSEDEWLRARLHQFTTTSDPSSSIEDLKFNFEDHNYKLQIEGIEFQQLKINAEELKADIDNHQTKKKNEYDDDGYAHHDDDVNVNDDGLYDRRILSYDSGELFFSISRELKPSTPARVSKVPYVSTFLGKAGNVGLEVLDTLGSSMTNLNAYSGFVSNMASRGNKVSILAFEVANTIVKGSNLMQRLSEESIQILKKEILHSEGVRLLVSTDTEELLRIAASDKREELDVFSREVVWFGNLFRDPQWHNLDHFSSRLDLYLVTDKQLRKKAKITMHELTNLAQYTSELYHEYYALGRLEQDYRRKLEEVEYLHIPRKGESFKILQNDVKHQRKLVRNLKKKSLWSKSMEEIVEKLVHVVTFIRQAIVEAFEENEPNSTTNVKEVHKKPETLGVAGLALHYANLVTQIDNIVSRPSSLPSNMRDNLYNGLPASVKAVLRSCLQELDSKEVMTVPQIKAEMEKTLQWLVPVATDTAKAHQGFGRVGEWANTGNEFGKKTAGSNNIIRLQTLHHADKQKMDQYILDIIILLHRLISLVTFRDKVPKYVSSQRSPPILKKANGKPQRVEISVEDRMLVPGISKSQEFVVVKKEGASIFASSQSMGSSPRRESGYANVDMLDVLDGLGTTF